VESGHDNESDAKQESQNEASGPEQNPNSTVFRGMKIRGEQDGNCRL
jgi:hypothetical protein